MSDNTKPPKIEQRIREACRVKHYSLSTERVYVSWYKRFVRWAGMKHPAALGGGGAKAWSNWEQPAAVRVAARMVASWATVPLVTSFLSHTSELIW